MPDSTTESEYFDDEEEGEEQYVGGVDPLGGVSTQSSAPSWSPPVAAAVTKPEPQVAATVTTHHDAHYNDAPIKMASPSQGSAAVPSIYARSLAAATSSGGGGGSAPTAPRTELAMATVKNELLPHATTTFHPAQLPMSSATQGHSTPAMAVKTQSSSHANGASYTQPGDTVIRAPLPPSHASATAVYYNPPAAASQPLNVSYSQPHNMSCSYGFYSATAAPLSNVSCSYGPPRFEHVPTAPHPVVTSVPAMPHVYGYHPPPPVQYAAPRALWTQNLPASEAVTTVATTTARAPVSGTYTTTPPSYSITPLPTSISNNNGSSSNQVSMATCGVCRASLRIPVVKSGLDCRCCGSTYPTAQFPTQDGQDKSYSRRCEACFATHIARSNMLRPSQTPFSSVPLSAATAATAPAVPRFTPVSPPPRIPSSPTAQQPSAPATHSSTSSPAAGATTSTQTPAIPRFTPVSPPPRIPSSPTAQQPSAVATQNSTSSSAGAAPTPAVPLEKCAKCRKTMFKVKIRADPTKNLECVCCRKTIPKWCFSKSQQKEGKYRCKACLGHTKPGPSGEPVLPSISLNTRSKQVATRATKKKPFLHVETPVLSAERQVVAYHLARRSLQRKREANDLRGATRVEYEKQLAKEEAELKVLERQLRARHPALFDKKSGIRVRAPPIPNDERDLRPATKKRKTPSKSELKGQKKKAQQHSMTPAAAANAVMRTTTTSRSASDVTNLAHEPSPQTGLTYEVAARAPKRTRVTMETLRAAAKADEASLAFVVADDDASPKPKKRKAATVASKSTAKKVTANKQKMANASKTATASTFAARPTAVKMRKTATVSAPATTTTPAVSAPTSAPHDDADPWLAAHDEIAQGLSQLLGGGLDDILSAGVSGGSSVKKKKSSATTSATKASAKAKAPAKAARSQVKYEPANNVKNEDVPTALNKEKKARPDPSTYVPKTKLQAEMPPQTTIVTRARRRTLHPVEIIDITDSPLASPRAKKERV